MGIILSDILPPAEELFSKEDWQNIGEHVDYWMAQEKETAHNEKNEK